MLERADKTSRILDVKYFLLLPTVARRRHAGRRHPVGRAAALGERASRCTASATAASRPTRIVEFLLLDREFPRAIHYCLTAARESLHAISGTPQRHVPQRRRAAARRALLGAGLRADRRHHRRRACTSTSTTLQTKMNHVGAAASTRRSSPSGWPSRSSRKRRRAHASRQRRHWSSVRTMHGHPRRPVITRRAIATTGRSAVAARRPAAAGAALPHADPQLLAAASTPQTHFPQLAAGPARQLPGARRLPETTRELSVEVDLVAEMTVINPFDFFLEPAAETFPFALRAVAARRSWRRSSSTAPRRRCSRGLLGSDRSTPRARTIDFLVELNRRLVAGRSATSSAWSRACRRPRRRSTLRHAARAATRLAAGADAAPPRARGAVRLRLPDPAHARRQAARRARRARTPTSPTCTPGPRSICPAPAGSGSTRRRACSPAKATSRWRATPDPFSAAPITGAVDECETDVRARDDGAADPRIPARHQAVHRRAVARRSTRSAAAIDAELAARDVRLTMGGEPTFVSIDDMDGDEWNTAALGADKRELAGALLRRLQAARSPRAACCTTARASGIRASRCRAGRSAATGAATASRSGTTTGLIADETDRLRPRRRATRSASSARWPSVLGVERRSTCIPAYEDVWYYLWRERRLPTNVDPLAVEAGRRGGARAAGARLRAGPRAARSATCCRCGAMPRRTRGRAG